LGYYQYDDEGVIAQRVALVDHGVLKNFEMSRSPLKDFQHSNGTGGDRSAQNRFRGKGT
jgi:TldD protein